MTFDRPERGFVFWPVGTGDSTSIFVNEEVVVQVDLNHLAASEDDDDERVAIVDELVECLPKVDDEPYLAAFALTHPDEDHTKGFEELLSRVTIGELWFSPRVFREYNKDLCDDAVAFRKEAKRRVKATIDAAGEDPGAGNRVRIIGYDDLLEEEDYKGLPDDRLSVPGTEITEVDGEELEGEFRGFVHAPFKDDSAGDRNDTSLGLQVTLESGGASGRALLLGDLCYPTITSIFERSDSEDLEFDVLLAPHHCSKSVMYWKEEGDKEEKLQQELMDSLENSAAEDAFIVSSSAVIPSSNEDGDNPPHAKAKRCYQEIVPSGHFLCTQEHPTEESPEPVVFELSEGGLTFSGTASPADEQSQVAAAIAAGRGDSAAPAQRVGFGCRS